MYLKKPFNRRYLQEPDSRIDASQYLFFTSLLRQNELPEIPLKELKQAKHCPLPVGILNKSMKVSSNLLLFYASPSLNRLAVREINDFSVNSLLSLTTRGLHQTLLYSFDKDILRYLSSATLTL